MSNGKNPRIVAFSGPPCTGKSTLAHELASRLGVKHLQMSQTRQRLMPASEHRRGEVDSAYRAMHFAVELLLQHGLGVIVESTYGRCQQRSELEDVAARADVPLFLVQCKIPSEIAVARFKRRLPGHPAIDLTESRVALLAESYPYGVSGLLLDTRASVSGCMAAIERHLREGHPVPRGEWSDSDGDRGSWPGPKP